MLKLTRAALIALGLCAAAALSPVFAADAPAAAASAPLPPAIVDAMPAAAAASAPEGGASAAAASEPAPTGSLDDRVQQTKADVIRLNRDLLVLEEELLFPANTQVAVFVSMDVGLLFDLDSVQIKLDDKVVTTGKPYSFHASVFNTVLSATF